VRQGRIKAPASHPVGVYHCTSRVVDKRRVLHEPEKMQFESFMREYARFCGVKVTKFTFLENHWHMVVKVPRAPKIPLTDEELLDRIEKLSGCAGGKSARQQLNLFRERGQHDAAEALRQRFLVRMWDISHFMKLLKQRFTQWFNKRHHRKGTLWEGRFYSTLVESTGEALACMAAYIDLNSVRASIASDPKDYYWCSYGRAVAGDVAAQEDIREIITGLMGVEAQTMSLGEAMRQYRMWLYIQGEENEGIDENGRPVRRGFSQEETLRQMLRKGRLPVAEYIRMRVRYFEYAVVMGSRKFVEEIFQANRSRFGPLRKTGARRMRGVDGEGLYVLRDLRKDVFGPPPVQPDDTE